MSNLSPPNKEVPVVSTQAPPSVLARCWTLTRRHWHKLAVLVFWLLLLAGYGWYVDYSKQSPLQMAYSLMEFFQEPYGPLLYILAFALRPLLLFSAALLTIAGGFMFGPLWGIIYTIIASNVSAAAAYLLGHFFGRGLLDTTQTEGVLQRYAARLRRNSFSTVLMMNLVFLPFDLINYIAGLFHMPFRSFLLATVLGSIPGVIGCVLLGSSIEIQHGDEFMVPVLHPGALLASLGLLVVSVLVARYLRRREAHREPAERLL